MRGVRLRLTAKHAILLAGVAFAVSGFSMGGLSAGARPTSAIPGDFDPVWTPDGRIAFYRHGRGVYTVKPNGTDLRRLPSAGRYAAWTRDGRKVAFSQGVETVCPQIVTSNGPLENSEIFVARADGSSPTRLTSNPAPDISPTWSPDGRRLAFSTQRDTGECPPGVSAVYVMNEDGSEQSRLTSGTAPDWSPKGDSIAYVADVSTEAKAAGRGINTIRPDGSGSQWLTSGPWFDDAPMFSPDGGRIVFTRSGWISPSGVYVMSADGTRVRRLASGFSPAWSRDGRQIAFERLRGRMEIYVMNADGSGQRKLLRSSARAATAAR
ncbi:MAG: PD40 domain-containing protein [Actinobacteria bacterium]|nr:PD40 domain-containing protein [Actinomycetota bacterium]